MLRKFTYFCLAFVLCASLNTAFAFTDLDESHSYYESVMALYDDGIVVGFDDGTFRPDAPVTRAEFLKMLINYADGVYQDEDVDDYSCFDDMQGHWAALYACWGKQEGFVNGDGDTGLFNPERNVNFVEAAKMVHRGVEDLFGLAEGKEYEWYVADVVRMQEGDRIPPSVTDLGQNLTRAEVAEILVNRDPVNFNTFYRIIDDSGVYYPRLLDVEYDGSKTWKRFESGVFLTRDGGIYNQRYELLSDDAENFVLMEFVSDNCDPDYFLENLMIWSDGEKYFQWDQEVGREVGVEIDCQEEGYGFDQFGNVFLDAGKGGPRLMIGADQESFEYFNWGLAKDKNTVYVNGLATDFVGAEFDLNPQLDLVLYRGDYYLFAILWEGYLTRKLADMDFDFETFTYHGYFGADDSFIFSDKNTFYFGDNWISDDGGPAVLQPFEWPGVDLATFSVGDHYHFEHDTINGESVIAGRYFEDSNNYYFFPYPGWEDQFDLISFDQVTGVELQFEEWYFVVPKDELAGSGITLSQ